MLELDNVLVWKYNINIKNWNVRIHTVLSCNRLIRQCKKNVLPTCTVMFVTFSVSKCGPYLRRRWRWKGVIGLRKVTIEGHQFKKWLNCYWIKSKEILNPYLKSWWWCLFRNGWESNMWFNMGVSLLRFFCKLLTVALVGFSINCLLCLWEWEWEECGSKTVTFTTFRRASDNDAVVCPTR